MQPALRACVIELDVESWCCFAETSMTGACMAGEVGCTGAVGPCPAASRLCHVGGRSGRILCAAGACGRACAPHAQPGARCLHCLMQCMTSCMLACSGARGHCCQHDQAEGGKRHACERSAMQCSSMVFTNRQRQQAELLSARTHARHAASRTSVLLHHYSSWQGRYIVICIAACLL